MSFLGGTVLRSIYEEGDVVVVAWTVRTGRHGEWDSWALNNGLVGGACQKIPDLTA